MSRSLLLTVCLTGLLFGCASKPPPGGQARLVMVEGREGVVALPRGEKDRDSALYLIAKKCGNDDFEIYKEAEERIGEIETTMDDQSFTGSQAGKRQTIMRQDKTEYRLYYRCN